jgi:hypothetical protein
VDEIDAALRDFTVLVDFVASHDEVLATVQAARERLKPLLECVNGTTAPLMYAFGHSHIDVAWLWPLAETERKCVRTFGTQLALMDQYPEYRFLKSQPTCIGWSRTTIRSSTSASRRRWSGANGCPKAACGWRPTPTSPAARA